MTAAEIHAMLVSRFPNVAIELRTDAGDPWIVVPVHLWPPIALMLRDDAALKFEMLNCVSGVDYLETDPKKAPKAGFEPHLEVVYHLSSFALKHRLTVKLLLPRWKNDTPGELPEVPSVSSIWPAADWHERETYDLCGVMFVGHFDLRRILMADDWIGHPLRKDYEYPLEYHDIRCR